MKLFARLRLIALTSLILGSVPAHAETYFGMNIGKSEHKFSSGSDNDTDLAWKLYGGYKVNQTFGVEAGYVAHGTVELDWAEGGLGSKAATLYVAGTATVPLSGQFSLIGKLGLADNRHKWSDPRYSNPTTTNTTAMAGIGLSYAFSPSMSGVVEYEDFGKVFNEHNFEIKARTLSVGLRKSF